MKIGILEWICGGGLQVVEPTQIASSLLHEGWAMLSTVARDFACSGHEVIASVDARALDRLELSAPKFQFHTIFNNGFTAELPTSWWQIASEADAVVVIAPEFSSILQTAIAKLTPICKLLLNCSGEFLAASCDKWLTAQRLIAAGVSHPATLLARDVTESWLSQHHNKSERWIIKPRDGAGCEAIQLVDNASIQGVLSTIRTSDLYSRMLIQPLHNGTAFSRSAIIDSCGRTYWLPLVTQEVNFTDSIVYCGGRVLGVSDSHFEDALNHKQYSIARLNEVLTASLEALGAGAGGWVGVDLLYSDEADDWLVIEVNPRLTTSFTGLSISYGPGLMQQMLRAAQGFEVEIEPNWKTVAFDACGHVA